MSKAIEPNDWEKFLTEFSERNKERRARFYIFFASGETLEEEQEGRFKGVSLNKNNGKTQVVVERGTTDDETMSDPIENVRGVAVQYEVDGSENILEITDEKNTLFSLRFESKLDGDS
ncbi:MAG: hypothetical protein M3525_09760 [Acidobacteriota bacterium]|nr:hypothetical protein [Acidobacteriota bacterium]